MARLHSNRCNFDNKHLHRSILQVYGRSSKNHTSKCNINYCFNHIQLENIIFQEYFSANRSMSILPVGIALMVSFMSAITLLGVSQENYTQGTQFVVINISYLIGTPIVCYGFLPVFHNLGATSAYEVTNFSNFSFL